MTNADYQKRLDILLINYQGTEYKTLKELHAARAEAKQALTALCRDVCGELIGNDYEVPDDDNFVPPAEKETVMYKLTINDRNADQRKMVTAVLGQPQEETNGSN